MCIVSLGKGWQQDSLRQGHSNLACKIHFTAEFNSNPNQTHLSMLIDVLRIIRKSAQREEIRPVETVFCWDTFGPGIHVDVSLTHTTYVKIVLDHINPFMVLLDGSCSFNQIMYAATQVTQEWFKKHEKQIKVLPWPVNIPKIPIQLSNYGMFWTQRIYCICVRHHKTCLKVLWRPCLNMSCFGSMRGTCMILYGCFLLLWLISQCKKYSRHWEIQDYICNSTILTIAIVYIMHYVQSTWLDFPFSWRMSQK